MPQVKYCKSGHSMIQSNTNLPEISQLEICKHSLELAKVHSFKLIYSLFNVLKR